MQHTDLFITVPNNLSSLFNALPRKSQYPAKSQDAIRICQWNINKVIQNAFVGGWVSKNSLIKPASQSLTTDQPDSVEYSPDVRLQEAAVQKSSKSGDNKLSDAMLISAYLENGDQQAFEELLGKYEHNIFNRIRKIITNSYPNTDPSEYEVLAQNVWIKAINNLQRYEDDGRFLNWMYTITANEVTDYFRQKNRTIKTKNINFSTEDDEYIDPYFHAEDSTRVDEDAILEEQIHHLETVLIPGMKVEQRLVYLLRFESTLWDQRQPLAWSHLARLNGITETQAWTMFESARKKLMSGEDQKKIDREEILIFLVWTQANRPEKSKNYTQSYFAELLGESENTLKTRYRSAEKYLQEGLKEFLQSGKNLTENS